MVPAVPRCNCQPASVQLHRFPKTGSRIQQTLRRIAMKKLCVLAFLAISLPAMAQSAFNGVWKFDLGSYQPPTKPDEYLLKDGMYHCKTCAPPYDIKADGTDQSVKGHPYMDTVAIKVVDDQTIEETDKKGGKVVTTSKTVVSPDGKTAGYEFS